MTRNKAMKAHVKNNAKKPSKGFLIVSISVVLIQFIVLVACLQLTNIYTIWANIIAFFVAFCLSLAGYFTLTFKRDTKKGEWFKNFFKLLVILITGFLIHQTLFVMGIETFGDKGYIFIWCVAMVIVTALFGGFVKVLNFVFGKFKGLNNAEKSQTQDSKPND